MVLRLIADPISKFPQYMQDYIPPKHMLVDENISAGMFWLKTGMSAKKSLNG